MIKKLARYIYLLSKGDELARFEMLWRLGKIVFPEYRFSWPQQAWWLNKDFNTYLEKFSEQGGMNTDRHWMLYQLLRLVKTVPGDTAECGVFQGASSYLMAKFVSVETLIKRRHFIFDSFEGISSPSERDGQHWQEGDLSCAQDVVAQNLIEFVTNVSFHKGWIPDRFIDIETRHFAFVHIDVDLYQPTKESMEFFYHRMSPGGIIVCDDYGYTNCPGATESIDEILADKPEKMLALPGGGGFLIKGIDTDREFLSQDPGA